MSNLRLVLTSVAAGGLLCGFVGAIIGAIVGSGTSILLPGVGLIVAGSLALGIVFGLVGIVLGSMLGLFAAAVVIIFSRGKNYP